MAGTDKSCDVLRCALRVAKEQQRAVSRELEEEATGRPHGAEVDGGWVHREWSCTGSRVVVQVH